MKKYFTVFICIINTSLAVLAQGEIDLQPKVFYRNEWSVAAMLNSNGFGANYRYGKRINARNKRLFEVDFAYMKHPKESKTYTPDGSRVVYGKTNLAFDFRFALGRQHEIFRKYDVGGIAIRYFYNYGPAVAMLKPIYYNVGEAVQVPGNPPITVIMPLDDPEIFDPTWYGNNIYVLSRSSFFKGFNKMEFVPGVFGKFGINFEYSKQDRIIHALEAGFIIEAFAKKVKILNLDDPPTYLDKVAKNQQFLFTLFVSYRFGRIVDPYEVKKKRERSKEISY
ncbi:MAG: hypothetical protein LBQ60_08875 [Bacteroidales bacterium]|nr:hypothetical protein [Bacteroidales bacterium]